LRKVAGSGGPGSRGGVVQVNFYAGFLSPSYRDSFKQMHLEIDKTVTKAAAEAESESRLFTYDDEQKIRRSLMDRIPRPPLSVLIDHVDHIAHVAGIDHVGLGSDFDGVFGQLPEGINSPADLPKITKALLARGYSAEDCHKILGQNLLRVFREVEAVARASQAKN
jgi:membrane dipeptidase